MALVVIFTRAGLDLDPVALRKLYGKVMILALIPWCAEAAVISVTVHCLLGLPWSFAVLCGSVKGAHTADGNGVSMSNVFFPPVDR